MNLKIFFNHNEEITYVLEAICKERISKKFSTMMKKSRTF